MLEHFYAAEKKKKYWSAKYRVLVEIEIESAEGIALQSREKQTQMMDSLSHC